MLQCDRDHDAQILNTAAAPDLYSGARQEHLGQAHIQEKGAIPRWSISTIGRSFAIFISRLPQLPNQHPSASRSENGISGQRSRTSVSVMRYHGRRRIAGRSFRKEPMFPASGASRASKPATTCGPPPLCPKSLPLPQMRATGRDPSETDEPQRVAGELGGPITRRQMSAWG